MGDLCRGRDAQPEFVRNVSRAYEHAARSAGPRGPADRVVSGQAGGVAPTVMVSVQVWHKMVRFSSSAVHSSGEKVLQT